MQGTEKISLQFTEDMKGFASFGGGYNYEEGYRQGRQDDSQLDFHLTIKTDDVDGFIADPKHEASASGYVVCPRLGGKCYVERGIFNLFTVGSDRNRRKMKYRLFFSSAEGQAMTLSGYKDVHDDPGMDVWRDTSTLFTNLYAGHIEESEESATTIAAVGILHILIPDFIRQLTTFRSNGATWRDRLGAMNRFGTLFAGSLWQVYGPSLPPEKASFHREIPLFTTEGVSDAEITAHAFHSRDKLGETITRFRRQNCDDVVVLIHGLTSSSDMFIMPEHTNLVQYLLDHGYGDVWAIDCRMSNRFPYTMQSTRYTMDDVALYDLPPAFELIREQLGADKRIHVICHCLGSVSFMMSLFGRQLSGIRSVISNSVSLTPTVSKWAATKLALGPTICDYAGIQYMDPAWQYSPGLSLGKVLSWGVSLAHKECDVPECHMLSFMWGSGSPAVYEHDNLHDITHRRARDLFGGVNVHYYRHVKKMIDADHTAVKYDPDDVRYAALPDNYFEYAAEMTTPILFLTGENNHVFIDSNIMTYRRLENISPGLHELHVYPGYGHQDVFIGKHCDVDTFPRMLKFLQQHSTPDQS